MFLKTEEASGPLTGVNPVWESVFRNIGVADATHIKPAAKNPSSDAPALKDPLLRSLRGPEAPYNSDAS